MLRKAWGVFGLIQRELRLCRLLMKDSRTPKGSRLLLGAAIVYAITPFDLLPNFIPVIGLVDDLIIIPTLVYLAFRHMPKSLVAEGRARV